MTITIHFGWWLLPFFFSLPFLFGFIRDWSSASKYDGIGGAFSALISVLWLFPPMLIWMIYFAVMYFTHA